MKTGEFLILTLISIHGASFAGSVERRFDEWAEGVAAEWVRSTPQFATRIQYFSADQQDTIDRELSLSGSWGNVLGAKATQARADVARRRLWEMRRFSYKSLTPTQRCSWSSIEWTLRDAIDREAFVRYACVFEQVGGFQIDLIDFLTSTHPIRNLRDVENYIARLKCIGSSLDEGIRDAQATVESGVIPPKVILLRVIEQLDSGLASSASENPLVTSLRSRMADLVGIISIQDQTNSLDEADLVVRREVIPAFQRLRAFLAKQLPIASDEVGLSRLTRGFKAYSKFLAAATTTDLTPDAIHAIGLREVGRIEAAMDQLFRRFGLLEGSVQDRVEALNRQRQPPESPDPRPTLLDLKQAC